MGFSLVGNSGDSSTTSTSTSFDASEQNNPQTDQQGSGAGALSVIISPTDQGSFRSDDSLQPTIYNSPITIVPAGNTLGAAALATQQATIGSSSLSSPSDSSGGLSTLLSGNSLYYILGAVVLLFLSHPQKG